MYNKLLRHMTPVRVFLVFLFLFGCFTAVLVGVTIANALESSSAAESGGGFAPVPRQAVANVRMTRTDRPASIINRGKA